MVGWMVWLSTTLFGDSPFGMRAVSIALGTVAILLTYLAGRRLYDERTGLAAGLLAATMPILFSYGARATPDAPLLFFAIATVWALSHALSGDAPWPWWLAAGAFLGGAMESKYTAIFLPAGVLLFVALSPDHRAWLRRPQPYVACLVALAMFAPTIVWNVRNDFISLQYQAVERLDAQRGFRWKQIWTYTVGQLRQVTPWLCVMTYVAGFVTLRRWRDASWQDRFVTALSLPVLLFFLFVLVSRSAHVHWTVTAYATGVLLVAAVALRAGAWQRRFYIGTVVIAGAVLAASPLIVPYVQSDTVVRLSPVADRVRALAPDFVAVGEYHDAASVGYLVRPIPTTDDSAWGKGDKMFPHWWRAEEQRGKTAVIVVEGEPDADWRQRLAARFETLGPPEIVTVQGRREKKSYTLIVARGYRPR